MVPIRKYSPMSSRPPGSGCWPARTDRCTWVCTSNAVRLLTSIVDTSRLPFGVKVLDIRCARPLANCRRRDARSALGQPQLAVGDTEHGEIGVHAGDHLAPGQRERALSDDLRLPGAVDVLHHDPDLARARDQVHGPADRG